MRKYIKESTLNWLLLLALLMLIVPAFLPLVSIQSEWAIYVYVAGAVLSVVVRLLQRFLYRKDKSISTSVRRLLHIEFWSAMCYLVSAYFMVSDPYSYGNWIAFLMAGAVLQIYTGQMIAWRQKKERKEKLASGKKE